MSALLKSLSRQGFAKMQHAFSFSSTPEAKPSGSLKCIFWTSRNRKKNKINKIPAGTQTAGWRNCLSEAGTSHVYSRDGVWKRKQRASDLLAHKARMHARGFNEGQSEEKKLKLYHLFLDVNFSTQLIPMNARYWCVTLRLGQSAGLQAEFTIKLLLVFTINSRFRSCLPSL